MMKKRWIQLIWKSVLAIWKNSLPALCKQRNFGSMSRIRGVVANYLASQARDPGIDSHQHLKDTWHIWRHLRNDTVFSCNLRCLLIFLHGCSRTYRVASLRAGPVGRISYNLYFDCKHVRYVTCDFNKQIYFFFLWNLKYATGRWALLPAKTRCYVQLALAFGWKWPSSRLKFQYILAYYYLLNNFVKLFLKVKQICFETLLYKFPVETVFQIYIIWMRIWSRKHYYLEIPENYINMIWSIARSLYFVQPGFFHFLLPQ